MSFEKKLGIHENNWSYTLQWIEYCNRLKIPYELVNLFEMEINHLVSFEYIVAYLGHDKIPDAIYSAQRIRILEDMGVKIFPDFKSAFFFDDKAIQADILSALGIKIPKTEILFSKNSALSCVENLNMPIVLKLRGGASGMSVRLIKKKSEAKRLVKKAFTKSGISLYSWSDEYNRMLTLYRNNLIGKVELFKYLLKQIVFANFWTPNKKEKDCIIIQEYIPNLSSDYRVVIIHDRCYAYQRLVDQKGFKASGTGNNVYDPKVIPKDLISLAFKCAEKLQMQVCAFDFVATQRGYLCLEFSVFFGYWSRMDDYYFNKHGEVFRGSDSLGCYILQKHLS